jgi:Ca-activated chloride channel family protein
MNWLSLNPIAAFAAWAGLAGLALWLYLHHRRPVRHKVSTLRFWSSVQALSQPRRRKLREPWALLAQVLFLLFMIIALANPRWGGTLEGRSVAIVMDTSAWSQMRPSGEASWLDQERAAANRLIASLPRGDRVLLMSAATDAPPILPFTVDRAALRRAIESTPASSGVADVPRALEMAKGAMAGSRRGLLVYIGPGMVDDRQSLNMEQFRASLAASDDGRQPQFIMRLVGGDAPLRNRGITRLSLRRDSAQPHRWHLLTQVKNYENSPATMQLKLSADGEAVGQRTLNLAPGELFNAQSEFNWTRGGLLRAELNPADDLDADNRAVVAIPAFRTVHVAIFSGNAPLLTDLLNVLAGNPYLEMQVVPPGTILDSPPDVAIYQGSSVPAHSEFSSMWFLGGQPAANARAVRVMGWNAQHPVTRWVRTRDVSVRNPAALEARPGDTILAYTEGNPPAPLILAREQEGRRLLIFGFDPHNSNFPLQSAFPLLMAGGMEWMTHSVDETAESLSTGELDIPGPATRILSPTGREVSFARKGGRLHLLATETGIYRVIAPGGETSVAVNTPLLPPDKLQATATESAEVEGEPLQRAGWDLWRWLMVLAIVALWLEWWLYYSSRERQRAAELTEGQASPEVVSVEGELPDGESSEGPAATSPRGHTRPRRPDLVA